MSNELIERVNRLQQECQDALGELAALKAGKTLKVDDKVMVRHNNDTDPWRKRYFKNWDGDYIRTFDLGATSWSTDRSSTAYKYWRLPTEEELK